MARQQAEELEHLRGEMQRLGILDAVELRRDSDELRNQIAAMRRDYAAQTRTVTVKPTAVRTSKSMRW
jgi:hypothetical protein